MDLLEQYKQQRPEAFQEQKPAPADAYGREYGAMIRMAMRLSGGRIRTAKQADMALIAFASIALVISLFFFFRDSGPALPSERELLRDTPTSGSRPGAQLPR
ncbi:MAG: hypothetical protein A3J10_02290 [Candidatus Sungbacteria bacterium RIFCSPLOWO2_02_FULL_54_10]|uniref:Uncharacterized protein n=2 Tax=Candidatus Sungiibacteriota TaxID=1817917 RepID=A0A1G2L627_9BACT|nr:MAG: hypothetical protein A2679_01220 [Candidatus Sungbacteria bacterium RIFCSPHIGHO2_01_FULL_54_26]OHA03288.1 MAG: hypothetical protein A3C92_03405 [Candidatus Sungbacteria bacterium RIFCSPHIGHO2_02_FULL_53_17]OHA07105.1 MAG: hypothetical protein A3B34_02065 [Candidatus Sungbacteria bacterium RIFCSPLOWO2_01_FULL_54_21]OHA12336.1 MAG: hypothetical protein A3J10_02290 [Candidatus Sungbacteria bacterium RIFCSPLOWO2_02_FULL_54_10]